MPRISTIVFILLISFNVFAISSKENTGIHTTLKDYFNSQSNGDKAKFIKLTSKEFRAALGEKTINELFLKNKGRKDIKKINLKIEQSHKNKSNFLVKLPYRGLEDLQFLVKKQKDGSFIIQESVDSHN